MRTATQKLEALQQAQELIQEALSLLDENFSDDSHFQTYCTDHIREHLSNRNPYNVSIESKMAEIEREGADTDLDEEEE